MLRGRSAGPPTVNLNPQYEGIPDIDLAGYIVEHPKLNGGPGETCASAINLDTIPADHLLRKPDRPVWQLVSTDPLYVEPSLLCLVCGDHGFIRGGRWVPA